MINLVFDETTKKFLAKIEYISGINVYRCFQCGRCSADCPSINMMDILPNQVLRFLQFGQVERVLSSKTIWICASCFTCTTRCPKGIDVAKILEAARQVNLRQNKDWLNINIFHDNLTEEEKEKIQKEKDINIIDGKRRAEFPTIALVSATRKLTA